MSQGLPKNYPVKNLIILDLNYFAVVGMAQSLQWPVYRPNDSRFDFGQLQEIFSFKTCRPTVGPIHLPIQWTADFFLRIRAAGNWILPLAFI